MHISYDNIVFDVIMLEDWRRDQVLSKDGTTFLFWHHQIVVTCIVNVDATAATNFPPKVELANQNSSELIGAPGQVRNAKPNNTTKRTTPVWTPRTDEEYSPPPPPPPRPLSQFGFGASVLGGSASYEALLQKQFPGTTPRARAQSVAANQPNDAGARNPFAAIPGVGAALAGVGEGVQVRGATRGTVPFTDVELRERLRRPRRQLLVWLDSGPNAAPEYMIASPLHPDAGVDALHGPICTVMQMPEIHGNVTGVMRLKFDTWEAPALEWSYVKDQDSSLKTPVPVQAALKAAQTPTTSEAKAVDAAAKAFASAIAKGKMPTEAAAAAIEAVRKFYLTAQGSAEAKIKGRTIAEGEAGVAGALAAQGAQQAAGADGANAVAALLGKNEQRLLATPALMSHRWSMAFGWSPETYLKTQTIQGEATFRADVLHMRGLTADQLRGYIWHPVPEGFRRRPIETGNVVLSPDGLGISYVIVDDQVMMNFPGGVEFGMINVQVENEMEFHGYTATGVGEPEKTSSLTPGRRPGESTMRPGVRPGGSTMKGYGR